MHCSCLSVDTVCIASRVAIWQMWQRLSSVLSLNSGLFSSQKKSSSVWIYHTTMGKDHKTNGTLFKITLVIANSLRFANPHTYTRAVEEQSDPSESAVTL